MSKIKSLDFRKRILFLHFVFFALFLVIFAPRAHAFESPLQSLLDASKGKSASNDNSGDGNGSTCDPAADPTTDNSAQGQPSGANQDSSSDNQPSSNVPPVVTDPKEIEDAAEFAANATGVSKDFLMGMLEVESDLGRNPGKCTYQEVADGAKIAHDNGQLSDQSWQTFQDRQNTMKDIASSLGYDYEQLKVSCNPGGAYAGTGGAMGVPQFMPDIWMDYKDRIAAIVGKENPDPWNVKDGAVAMALLVSDTPGVTDHNLYAERDAAKMYLSGCTSSKYDWYADQIFYWAQNYGKLLG